MTAIPKVFRDPLHSGKPGRARLLVCEALDIVQVVKQRAGPRLVSITRRLAHGCLVRADAIRQTTQVQVGRIDTA